MGVIGALTLLSTATYMGFGGRLTVTAREEPTESIAPAPRALKVFDADSGAVHAVAFNRTATEVAGALGDGSVRIWDLQSGQIASDFVAHQGRVGTVQYHPTRPLIVTCGDDGRVKVWDTFRLRLMRDWKTTNAVRSVAFSTDGTKLVAGDAHGTLLVWDVDSEEELLRANQSHAIDAVSWSSDGNWIVSVGTDKVVRIWDSSTLQPHKTLAGHRGPIDGVAFCRRRFQIGDRGVG